MISLDLERIKILIKPLLDAEQIELFDANYSYQGKRVIIRFILDKFEGGITINGCEHLNQRIAELIEQENFIDGSYVLEVASPGLDRPLKTEKDFHRAIGENIRLFLRQAINGKIEMEGTIKTAGNDEVIIDADNDLITIPISIINKAKIII